MAQHDYDINSADAISGLQFRADLNAALGAVKSTNSGLTPPAVPIAGMLWFDTSVTPAILKQRDKDNLLWNPIGGESTIGTPVASAATTIIGNIGQGDTITITGTTTISSFGTSVTGTHRTLLFSNGLTISNSINLILPMSEDLLIVSGDIINVICTNGALGYWVCTATQLNNPKTATAPVTTNTTQLATTAFAVPRTAVTGAAAIPSGTTAQRPLTPLAGYIRFNIDLNSAEVWNGTIWTGIGGGATGGGADTVFVETSFAVTTSYALTAGKSAMTVGDANGNVTIANGATVTIPTGAKWVIL